MTTFIRLTELLDEDRPDADRRSVLINVAQIIGITDRLPDQIWGATVEIDDSEIRVAEAFTDIANALAHLTVAP